MPSHPFHKTAATLLLSTLAAATMVACQPAVPSAQAAAASPAPVVAVAAVQQRNVAPAHSQVGRVEAAQRVDVRPRVAGHVDAVLFREGDMVRAGQPLFRIDTRPFDLAVDRARAELNLARSRESLARSEAERAQRLAKESAMAGEEVERRTAAFAEAQARTAAAQAALQAVSLDREFAVVTAPIAGRVGRALVTAGNFVAAGTTQLTTLGAAAPLHVHFDIGDPTLVAQVAAARQAGQWQARIIDAATGAELGAAPVDFIDNEMPAQVGTLRLRARLDKPTASLVPGQFVRVQMAGRPRDSLLVPEAAIGTDQGQRYVLAVKEGKLEYRGVKTGAALGDQRIVTSGIAAGEQVVVSGHMKLRPGMAVQVAKREDARSAP
ncbi:MAG: efflux RND transporter periplasmic adaptor subunit [Burkholderiales bacterium]|nr:efflux RND transporter periplasmic adaptor subunit [Burkholderiales bacterium]